MTSLQPSLYDFLIENAESKGLSVSEALAGKDMGGQDLSDKHLSNFNLKDTILNGSILCRVHLSGANLTNAQLRGANLNDADLRGTNLFAADLRGSNLKGVDFSGAILEKVKIEGAELSGNTGLNQEVRSQWKKQGANFKDETTITKSQWWIQYVVIPILVALISSSFMGLWKIAPNQSIPHKVIQPKESAKIH
jgi:uncharacterized protein YjbI with pentapeptide repeats